MNNPTIPPSGAPQTVGLRPLRRTLCYICQNDLNPEHNAAPGKAVAICNELNKPVCAMHTAWCDKEGHGHRPLED